VNQRPVESFIISEVKDEPLPSDIPGFAPGTEYINRLLSDCPFAFTHPAMVDSLPFSTPPTEQPAWRLHQTSQRHQRSLEVRDPALPELWTDEFGNTYGNLNLKGNGFYHPTLFETTTASERVIAFGLQESNVIERVIKASQLMRAAGIGTEYILGLAEPKQYAVPDYDWLTDQHTLVPLGLYKSILVNRYWGDLPEADRTAERLVELQRATGRMTFYVSARAMDTTLRLDEIEQTCDNHDTVSELFEHANKHYLPEGELGLTMDSRNDSVRRLLTTVTAPRLANNLLKLHCDLELAHRYPNAMNITALGSLVDLDSVHGEALGLGDEPITADDIVDDLVQVMQGISAADRLGRTHDETPQMSPTDVLLDSYQQGYKSSLFSRQDIAAAALRIMESPLVHDDTGRDVHRNVMAGRVFQAFYDQSLVPESVSFAEQEAAWVEQNLELVQTLIDTGLEKNIGTFQQVLLYEAINEISSGNITNPADLFMKHGTIKWGLFASEALVDMLAEDICEQMLASSAFEELDLVSREAARQRLIVTAHTIRQAVYTRLGAVLPCRQNWLYDQLLPRPSETILRNNITRRQIFVSEENRYVTEADYVDLQELLDDVEALSDSLTAITIAPFEPIDIREQTHIISEDDEDDFSLLSTDNTFLELITDGYVDGSDAEDYQQLNHISAHGLVDASYVASVERTPGGGYVLQFKFEGLAPEKACVVTDPAEIATLLGQLRNRALQTLLPIEVLDWGSYTSLQADEAA
jgi:hypothetical protein